MSTIFVFPFSIAIGGRIATGTLDASIRAAIPTLLIGVTTAESEARIEFESDLTPAQEADLEATVRAHDGRALSVKFHAASKILDSELRIASDEWQTIGGVVANPSFFVPFVANARGRCVGGAKAIGGSLELRILEDDGASILDLMNPPFVIGDTHALWVPFRFSTAAPRAGEMTYLCQARLAGASEGFVRFASLSVLEIVRS